MVSHRKLGEFTPDFFEKNKSILTEVTGRINEIHSSQQGSIILDCGLEAFFVPNVGRFTERDKNERIKCYIGFRYDQIQAWSVLLYNVERDAKARKQEFVELKDLFEDKEELDMPKAIHAPDENRIELPRLNTLKVVGKIKLDAPQKHEQTQMPQPTAPEFNTTYRGEIKILKHDAGFIEIKGLDKNVAFNISHLRGCKIADIKEKTEVSIKVSFFNNVPKTDVASRNYIAQEVRKL